MNSDQPSKSVQGKDDPIIQIDQKSQPLSAQEDIVSSTMYFCEEDTCTIIVVARNYNAYYYGSEYGGAGGIFGFKFAS